MTHFVRDGRNLEADTLRVTVSVSSLVEKSKTYFPHACRCNNEDVRSPHRRFHDFFLLALIIAISERWTRYVITESFYVSPYAYSASKH